MVLAVLETLAYRTVIAIWETLASLTNLTKESLENIVGKGKE